MKKVLLLILVLSVLLNIGLFVFLFSSEPIKPASTVQNFPYLSKRIFVGNNNDILLNFTKLRTEIRALSATLKTRIGVYFEYLPTGTSIGINEKEEFYPASLLKVPIVMAIYRKLELNELKKTDLITIQEDHLDSESGSLWIKGAGKEISIEEAIKFALIDSDNTAKNVLLSKLDEQEVEFVLDSVDIGADAKAEDAKISPKNYASIYRSLYLSSLLTEENSNEILQILTQAKSNNFMKQAVPENIPIAHKYGIAVGNSVTPPLYSECAIIYVPKRPYVLCMMIQAEQEEAGAIIKQMVAMTYKYVSNQEASK